MTKKELKAKVIMAKDEIVEALYEADKMAWEDGLLAYTVYLAEKNGDLSVVTISSRPTKEVIESYARNYGTPVRTIKEFCYRNMDRVRGYFGGNREEAILYLYGLMDDETRMCVQERVNRPDDEMDDEEVLRYIELNLPTTWEDCIVSLWNINEQEHMKEAENRFNDFLNSL